MEPIIKWDRLTPDGKPVPSSYTGRCPKCDNYVLFSYPGGKCWCGRKYEFTTGWAIWSPEYNWRKL